MTELDPSQSKIQYKRLQSIIYEFMGKFNLYFKVCQTLVIEDKDLTEDISNFKKDFQDLFQQLNYKNDEIYNMDETGLSYEIAHIRLFLIKNIREQSLSEKRTR